MRHLVLAVAALACSASASAEIITYEFTGIINSIREVTNGNLDASRRVVKSTIVPGTIAIGDTFRGMFSYDTATSVSSVSTDTTYYSAPWGSTGTATSLVIDKSGAAMSAQGPTWVGVTNGAEYDSVSFRPATQFGPYASFNLSFYDASAAVLDSQAIPVSLDFNDFWSADANFTWDSVDGFKSAYVYGQVTSFERVSPVPEPSTYALLFAGLAIVGGAASRKRNRIHALQD